MAHSEPVSFQGQAGNIDCQLDFPDGTPKGWALVLHPHPLHGGARENKVAVTIARACVQHGLVAVRPNFRGVGASEGEFDNAVGETADMHLLVQQLLQQHPELAALPWVLAGFSFGTSVAAQLHAVLAEQNAQSSQTELPAPEFLILVGSAVERFRFREIAVPPDTLLIHGELDDVVPLEEAMQFARAWNLPVAVLPNAGHFFHGKLPALKQLLQWRLASL